MGCNVGDFSGGESSIGGVLSPTIEGVWPVMSMASCLDGIFKAGGRWDGSLCWRRGFGATMTVVLVSRTAKEEHGSTEAENPSWLDYLCLRWVHDRAHAHQMQFGH